MKVFVLAQLSVLVASLFVVNPTIAQGKIEFKKNKIKHFSRYVTPQSNPEHFLRYNASRTCGNGYNPMTKHHRRNHRCRRAHTHPSMPWYPGCSK
jgi:hypothetical protein